ncbi:S-layer homology domain-containing protein [Paenibacillus sp. y28]|uniref:S-layer homology domain-containing protein n=1 Tax=Paenibacillus sp. y28 TaxID=3129110 RepID=UPI00301A69FF
MNKARSTKESRLGDGLKRGTVVLASVSLIASSLSLPGWETSKAHATASSSPSLLLNIRTDRTYSPGTIGGYNADTGLSAKTVVDSNALGFDGFASQVYSYNGKVYGLLTPADNSRGGRFGSFDGTRVEYLDSERLDNAQRFAELNGTLYFLATDLESSMNLYAYDTVNSVLSKVSGDADRPSVSTGVAVYNGQIYYMTDQYLVRWTGSAVENVWTLSSPYNGITGAMTVLNGELYFAVTSPTLDPGSNHLHNNEIFKYDGSSVSQVTDRDSNINNYASVTIPKMIAYNNKIFYSGENPNNVFTDPGNGKNWLISTDENGNETTEFEAGDENGGGYVFDMWVVDNQLYFSARVGNSYVNDLYLYDSTGNATNLTNFTEEGIAITNVIEYGSDRYVTTMKGLYRIEPTSNALTPISSFPALSSTDDLSETFGQGAFIFDGPLAPVVTNLHDLLAVLPGGSASIAANAVVSDIDSASLASASVRISSGFSAGDTLSYTQAYGIAGSFDANTGVLSLSGTATAAEYQEVLRSVVFTGGSEPGDREVVFALEDSESNLSWSESPSAVATVAVAPSAGTITKVEFDTAPDGTDNDYAQSVPISEPNLQNLLIEVSSSSSSYGLTYSDSTKSLYISPDLLDMDKPDTLVIRSQNGAAFDLQGLRFTDTYSGMYSELRFTGFEEGATVAQKDLYVSPYGPQTTLLLGTEFDEVDEVQMQLVGSSAQYGTGIGGLIDDIFLFSSQPGPMLSATSYSPADGASGVDAASNLSIGFAEPVTAVSGKNLTIRQGWDDQIVETIPVNDINRVTISGADVTINPDPELLYGSDYYVLIDGGAFAPVSGSALYGGVADQTTWNFTTEVRSEVTAANSTALQAYLSNSTVSTINLIADVSYAITGVDIDRALTVNGNQAEVTVSAGIPVTSASDAGLSYYGDGVFDVGPAGNLALKDVTLRNGSSKIMTVINVQDGGQLELDNSKLKDFFGENDGNQPNRGFSFAIHTDPGSGSQVTITDSEIDESNAFRNMIDVRGGMVTVRGNTLKGTQYPDRLRLSDGFEYGIYLYGGSTVIENNTIAGFDSSRNNNYASAAIGIVGFYDTTLSVTGNTLTNSSVGLSLTNHYPGVNPNAITTMNTYAMNQPDTAGKGSYSVSKQNTFSGNGANVYSEMAFYTRPYTYRDPQLSVTAVTYDSVTVAFPKPGASATSVKLQLSEDEGDSWQDAVTGTLTGDSAGATATGLDASTSYLFRLVVEGGSYYGYSNFAPATTPTNADAAHNTLGASPSTVQAGSPITLTATGDRQGANSAVIGDERYIPVNWQSSESGQSGVFSFSGASYTSTYTPAAEGGYTVTATFEKQAWDGTVWQVVNGSQDTKTASVTVTAPVDAATPSISAEPQDRAAVQGDMVTLSVTASVGDAGQLTYQWYSSSTDSNTGGILIAGATGSTYTVPTSAAGDVYYYVVVTNTNTEVPGQQTVTATSRAAKVTVSQAPTYGIAPIADQTAAVLSVGYASGTQETMTITLTNTGTSSLTNLSAALSGTGASAFDLTPPPSTLGAEAAPASFTVRAKDGLSAGTYTATVTVSADHLTPVTFTVTQAVQLLNAPANPQGLTGVKGDNSVILNWNTVTDATYYYIYMASVSGGYSEPPLATVTSATYSISNLTNGTSYYFIVKAGGTGGVSAASNEIHVIPATVPSAPTAVTAVAGDRRATITFTAPQNTGGSAITGYEITISPGSTVISADASPVTITGLTNGVSYTFTVKAINDMGRSDASEASNAVMPKDSSSNDSRSSSGSGSSSSGTVSSIEVLVNGKAENAGTASTSERSGQNVLTISVDQKKLDDKLAAEGQGAVVTIPVQTSSDVVIGELNGQMIKNMEDKQAVLELRTAQAGYTLPAGQIQIDAISAQLGSSIPLADIKIQIEISSLSEAEAKVVESAAAQGSFEVVVPSLEFTVTAAHDGKVIEVTKFNAFVERTIAIPDGVDPGKITTGVVVEPDGTVRHVPTKVTLIDGKYYAKVNSLTNSTYSIVWHPIEFRDVAGHWSQAIVNNMGSRMVINGTGEGVFSPDADITRAEFAAILVRGLGLRLDNGTPAFSDVQASDWYSKAVITAQAYGLIEGFEDGTFRPGDRITREQGMAMIAKAMKLTGLKAKLSGQTAGELLSSYTDGQEVAGWAQTAAADVLKAGIVSGRSDARLMPTAHMTRAEVAAMLQRLLQASDLI